MAHESNSSAKVGAQAPAGTMPQQFKNLYGMSDSQAAEAYAANQRK